MHNATATGIAALCTLSLLTLAGCVSNEIIAPPIDSISFGALDNLNAETLDTGRTLYLQRCSRCHAPPVILKHTATEWGTLLPDMLDESALHGSKAQAVVEYVEAVLRAQTLAKAS